MRQSLYASNGVKSPRAFSETSKGPSMHRRIGFLLTMHDNLGVSNFKRRPVANNMSICSYGSTGRIRVEVKPTMSAYIPELKFLSVEIAFTCKDIA
jgi:hypothetical protein